MAQASSLYRAMLRELPRSSPPSPLQLRIRHAFRSSPAAADREADLRRRIQEGEQFVQYARAQRTYVALLERYNPGIHLDEEERVALTARRVGLALPVERKPEL
jgi:ATP synthase assembly factor FMC1, mitochondrial